MKRYVFILHLIYLHTDLQRELLDYYCSYTGGPLPFVSGYFPFLWNTTISFLPFRSNVLQKESIKTTCNGFFFVYHNWFRVNKSDNSFSSNRIWHNFTRAAFTVRRLISRLSEHRVSARQTRRLTDVEIWRVPKMKLQIKTDVIFSHAVIESKPVFKAKKESWVGAMHLKEMIKLTTCN